MSVCFVLDHLSVVSLFTSSLQIFDVGILVSYTHSQGSLLVSLEVKFNFQDLYIICFLFCFKGICFFFGFSLLCILVYI